MASGFRISVLTFCLEVSFLTLRMEIVTIRFLADLGPWLQTHR